MRTEKGLPRDSMEEKFVRNEWENEINFRPGCQSQKNFSLPNKPKNISGIKSLKRKTPRG